MDFKSIIYASARDGKLKRLQVFLEHRDKDEILQLVSAETDGATPLIMACKNGHFDVVEYLIKKCGADIEQPGAVTFDGDTIGSASPLWCAAAVGHLPVVKLLVRLGANVNSMTNTNSTPLRAACFDGHFEVIKFLVQHGADVELANKLGHTVLMISSFRGYVRITKFLIDANANINRKSSKGHTALHDSAETGYLEIFKLLLEHGARMSMDSYGLTPLLVAAVTGHAHIVDYLVEKPGFISRKDKIDALELLGATYVDKKRDMVGAHGFWKRAMEERYNSDGPIMPKPVSNSIVAAYNFAQEVTEFDALDDLLTDPDDMRMQALVVRERILGPAHPDTSYYIRHRGAIYANSGKFERCIELWNYALDVQQTYLEPLNPMTLSSLFSITEIFNFMVTQKGKLAMRSRQIPSVSKDDLLRVFYKAVMEIKLGKEVLRFKPHVERDYFTYLNKALIIALHLACLLTLNDMEEGSEEHYNTHKALYELIKVNAKGAQGRDVLLLTHTKDAILVGRYPTPKFPSVKLTIALLEAGADVNSKDNHGNTALHLLALSHPWRTELALALLERGAHIDAVNNDNKTFEMLLSEKNYQSPPLMLKFTSLACLAARVVRKNFEIATVPSHLREFVLLH